MKKILEKNWKTNITGILVGILVGIYAFKLINTEQFLTIFGVLVTAGFISAKDSNESKINTLIENEEIGLPKPKDPKRQE